MSLTDEEIAKLEEVTRLFKIRRTALEMLSDRGYLVNEEDMKMDKKKFIEKFEMDAKREKLFIQTHKHDDPSNQVFVIFLEVQKKVGCAIVKDCILRMRQDNVSRAILVVQQDLTPQAKAAVNEVSGKFQIEIFQDKELLVNITHHELVPKHEVLSFNEAKEMMKKYNVTIKQLPRMLVNDPVARYFGLKQGQVVKITRPSETAGTYTTYRGVL